MKQYRKLLALMLLLIVSGGVFAQDLFDKAKLDNYFGILEDLLPCQYLTDNQFFLS